jgi:hypothetical protein
MAKDSRGKIATGVATGLDAIVGEDPPSGRNHLNKGMAAPLCFPSPPQ